MIENRNDERGHNVTLQNMLRRTLVLSNEGTIPADKGHTVFLLINCKLKTNFIGKCQLLYMGCPLRRERKQKKNQTFHFQKWSRPLTRECPLTGTCKYRV